MIKIMGQIDEKTKNLTREHNLFFGHKLKESRYCFGKRAENMVTDSVIKDAEIKDFAGFLKSFGLALPYIWANPFLFVLTFLVN